MDVLEPDYTYFPLQLILKIPLHDLRMLLRIFQDKIKKIKQIV